MEFTGCVVISVEVIGTPAVIFSDLLVCGNMEVLLFGLLCVELCLDTAFTEDGCLVTNCKLEVFHAVVVVFTAVDV